MNKLENTINTILLNNSNEKDFIKLSKLIVHEILSTQKIYSSVKSDEYNGTFNLNYFYSYEEALENAKSEALSYYKNNITEITDNTNKIIAFKGKNKNFGPEFFVEAITVK